MENLATATAFDRERLNNQTTLITDVVEKVASLSSTLVQKEKDISGLKTKLAAAQNNGDATRTELDVAAEDSKNQTSMVQVMSFCARASMAPIKVDTAGPTGTTYTPRGTKAPIADPRQMATKIAQLVQIPWEVARMENRRERKGRLIKI